jgi:photosystem II stability/assembly factor-like uncharacterized protein
MSALSSSILFLALVLPFNAPARCEKQASGTLAWLHSVYFIDDRKGWAVGGKGALLSTVDGGANWSLRARPSEDTLREVVFTTARIGWIVCERSIYELRAKDEPRSYLLKTEDGGETWSRVDIKWLDPDAIVARIVFVDHLRGWLMGEAGLLFVTTDGGSTWRRQLVPSPRLLLNAHFLDARRGWISGAGSTLLSTRNGGATWRAGRILASNQYGPFESPAVRFNAVSFIDANRGWAVGAGGAIFATGDGGGTWMPQQSGVA